MTAPHLETIEATWDGLCIVAATGESLTKEAAELCRGHHVIAISQAWERLPFAEILYSCDAKWWEHYQGCPAFAGERWSSWQADIPDAAKKPAVAAKYGIRLVAGRYTDGLSTDPSWISFGPQNHCNSGLQGIGLAVHKLRGSRKRILMIGIDLVGDYFYGKKNPVGGGRQFGHFVKGYEKAAENLPPGVEIINCSPLSILSEKVFPKMALRDALSQI